MFNATEHAENDNKIIGEYYKKTEALQKEFLEKCKSLNEPQLVLEDVKR